MAGDPSESVTATLQAKWYNILTSQLGLSSSSFQLLQPSTPLGATSDQLWSYFNDLPPATIDNHFTVSGGNRFYDDYRGVLSQLLSQNDGAFRRILGDNYSAWIGYIRTVTPPPALEKLPDVFRSWAYINAPDIAQTGATALANGLNDPIFLANMAVQNTTGFINNTPDWNKTIQDLRDAIQQAESRTIDFDSNTSSSDVTKTWAQGQVEGFYDIFTGNAGGSYSALSSKIAASQVTVKGSFKHVLTFSADPGSWYNSSALGSAYQTQDNTLWKHGTPSWDTTFGPKGNMLRFTSSLVVVDGIDMTIHSEAALSTDEQTEVTANLSVGIWPFFSLGASGGYKHDASYSSSGAATVQISSPANNPVVLGGNVLSVADYLSSGGRMRFVPHAVATSVPSGGAFAATQIAAGALAVWAGRAQGYVLRISKQQWKHPVTYAVRDSRGATIGAGHVSQSKTDSGDIVVHRNTSFTVFNVGAWPLVVTHT